MEESRYIKRKSKALNDGNREQLAVSCKHLGDYYNQQGKYADAVKEYQQEAEIYAKLGRTLERAKAHRMVGEMFMLLCEFDNAKEHINIYLRTVQKLQNKVEEQRAYATLGRAHLLHGQSLIEILAPNAVGQLKQAEKAFLRSLLLIKDLTGQISKLEQLDMQARCYLNIGVVKEHMEEFDESVAYIEKAINISKTHDIFELTHLCYISMSLLYHCKMNNPTLALRYCNMALEVAKRLPNKVKSICETLITKSEILIKEGDFASAKQILTKAYKKNTPNENDRKVIEKSLRIVVKICQTLDELVTTNLVDYTQRKRLYEKLGDGCCHLLNYAKALEYYKQMLEAAELNGESGKDLVPIYVSLYQTYKDNKQYDQALEYLWKEFELNKDVPQEAFLTLCGIAEVCELQTQSFWTIQHLYQRAKAEAAKTGNSQGELYKIVYARLKKLCLKHNMDMMADQEAEEAKSKGIDWDAVDCEDESDNDSDAASNAQNTPELGDDVCLDDLTDSDTSDLDETEKPRPHRATRGNRSITIKRNNKGETPLHQACIAGNLELVRRLLDQGHVINVRDHAGWLPLHEACNHGFRDIVELLLDRGSMSSINDKGGTSCDGITPLYDACSNGYLDVIELLVERGADVTVKTDFGETCINGLDKWRAAATLTDGEQAHYEQLRAAILERLSKVGIGNVGSMAALTNANVEAEDRQVYAKALLSDEDDEIRPTNHRRRSDQNRSRDSGWDDIRASAHIRRSDPNGTGDSENLKEANRASPRLLTASAEYRNVMEQLKHPHRAPAFDSDPYYDAPSSSTNSLRPKRSALLDVDEVDDASWMIDDIGPEKKKRRHYTNKHDQPFVPPSSSSRISLSKENLHDSAICTAAELESLTPEADAFQVLLDAGNASTRQRQSQKLRLRRTSSMSSNSSTTLGSRPKSKQQASLLDSGFCRFRSESPLSSEESREATLAASMRSATTEPDSTTTSIQLLISPAKSSPIKVQATSAIVPSTMSFKIRVENELLLVPVERRKLQELNIRWLAEEAARRYYNLVGMKPVLRLKTSDGFGYEENDPINVAVEHSIILATVLEWKTSSLAQRYEEVCGQLNKDIDSDVQTALEHAQSSNGVQLENLWLTPEMMEPFFKALMHQTNLRVLDLCNNLIQNEGCRQLARSLPTLSQLKTLNLKGNFITSEGLEFLLAGRDVETMPLLEELNLSQNPLGDVAVPMLDRYCQSVAARSLQRLLLSQCGFGSLQDFDLCYFQLTVFDISYNQLTDEALRNLLGKLNACRLQHLNLSYTKSTHTDERNSLAMAERIVDLFQSGTCEQFQRVELCGCHLGDANLYRIAECCSHAKELELLDISENIRLSSAALQFLLDKVPQLRKLVATNCSRLIDGRSVMRLAQHEQIPNFMALTLDQEQADSEEYERKLRELWQMRWGNKALVRAFAGQLFFYVNEKDLVL